MTCLVLTQCRIEKHPFIDKQYLSETVPSCYCVGSAGARRPVRASDTRCRAPAPAPAAVPQALGAGAAALRLRRRCAALQPPRGPAAPRCVRGGRAAWPGCLGPVHTFKNRPGAEVHGATRCVTSCLVPGFGEELLFRGALQQKLCALLGTVPAVAACAVAFGAAHFLTPLYFLLSALGSLFFSACMTLRSHPRPRWF